MKFVLVHGLSELEKMKQSGARQEYAVLVEHCRIVRRRGFSFFSDDSKARPMVVMQSQKALVGCRLLEGETPPPDLAVARCLYL